MVNKPLQVSRYWGSKLQQLDFILPLMPVRHGWVDLFHGSGVVTLNRPRSRVEHMNDMNLMMHSLFKAVRDHKDELIAKIEWTPRSREEYDSCVAPDPGDDVVEIARKAYVRLNQGRNGAFAPGVSWVVGGGLMDPGSWKKSNYEGQFERIRERLGEVFLQNMTAMEMLEWFNIEDCVYYADPPYPHSSRKSTKDYEHEMSEQDHVDLARAMHDHNGFRAISGYRCDLYDDLYSDWHRFERATITMSGNSRQRRVEVLWTSEPAQTLL